MAKGEEFEECLSRGLSSGNRRDLSFYIKMIWINGSKSTSPGIG